MDFAKLSKFLQIAPNKELLAFFERDPIVLTLETSL